MKKIFFFVLLYIISISTKIYAQNNLNDSAKVFVLKEVMVFNKPNYNSIEEVIRYNRLKRKIIKVYPYAILVSKRLIELDKRLEKLKTKRQRKKYIQIIQRYINKKFTPVLKQFTQSEGRIMIQLIYRQTGKNTYEIIKTYKGGWNAFWSNTTASFFNLHLKAEYNPFKYKKDLEIESILGETFESGILEYKPAFWEKLPLNDAYFEPINK